MSSVNITREEAQQRSQVITAHSSKVLVDLSGRDPNGDPLGEPGRDEGAASVVVVPSRHGTGLPPTADSGKGADRNGQQGW